MAEEVIEIKGLNSLLRRLSRLSSDLFGKDIMSEVGLYIIAKIEERTASGVAVTGMPFKPYSPGYSLFKEKRGYPNIVNLFLTGSMLSSMTFEASEDQVSIYFLPTEDRKGVSNPAKAFWLNQDRHFFAISADERSYIVNLLRGHIHDLISGAR